MPTRHPFTHSPEYHSTSASAPGKVILLGEHAVVYGRPAIAVPVTEVTATATVLDRAAGQGCTIVAYDLDQEIQLSDAGQEDPLALAVRLVLSEMALPPYPDWRIEIRSQIPIASGLGSGAAVSTALVRALFRHAGQTEPSPAQVSDLVYRCEEIYHGTPSGIDNTVIAHEAPIWYVKGGALETFQPGAPLTLAIADSGIPSPTRETVADVRRAWLRDPDRYEAIFTQIEAVAVAAKEAMERADIPSLGRLMTQNQALLEDLGVSAPPLRQLIQVSLDEGAFGAKLSGGGRGGNVLALIPEAKAEDVSQALKGAGARHVIATTVSGVESATA